MDNSVKYTPQSEPIQGIDSKPNTIRIYSNPRKQKKIFHKTKKITKNVADEGFGILEGIMHCYF